ncbi:MAG: DEAD/DEAH box helicase [Candidatus Izemoplasmatales bacterium]|nr:DEAD/DEAH box helicase [Candidatus Izemoplasmatales bacterium]
MKYNHTYVEDAVKRIGFTQYTDVQEKIIPLLSKHMTFVCKARTGSGKTHSYLLPIFDQLDLNRAEVQAVIIAPTKDLAEQIVRFARELFESSANAIDLRIFTGATDRTSDIQRLEKSQPQVVVGTPGRLFDLIRKENVLKAYTAAFVVIDEADMTLGVDFIEQMDGIMGVFQSTASMSLFSATLPETIKVFVNKYFQRPSIIEMDTDKASNRQIIHSFVKTKERDRIEVLASVLSAMNPYQAVVFCNTKESANLVHQWMKEQGFSVALIHGDVDERRRRQIIRELRDLKHQYLVATDIMSRGIDLEGLSHVINFELPRDPAFYLHRTGRTGRMAFDGVSISLYDLADDSYVDGLESRGIATRYVEIVNKEIVAARVRSQRTKRVKPDSPTLTKLKTTTKKPTDIKPNYRKKQKEKLEKAAKKADRRR